MEKEPAGSLRGIFEQLLLLLAVAAAAVEEGQVEDLGLGMGGCWRKKGNRWGGEIIWFCSNLQVSVI